MSLHLKLCSWILWTVFIIQRNDFAKGVKLVSIDFYKDIFEWLKPIADNSAQLTLKWAKSL